MEALQDEVGLKAFTWNSIARRMRHGLAANYLLVGDKGCTIPEVFAMLRGADLSLSVWWLAQVGS